MARRPSVLRRDPVEAKPGQGPQAGSPTPVAWGGSSFLVPRYLIPWLLLFAGSGVAALIYEIVWFQLLELVIGSSAVSLAVLLATFMGGTCLGSLMFPRLVSARRNPLRVYGAIEIGIGILGILVLQLIPLVGGVLFRGIVAA